MMWQPVESLCVYVQIGLAEEIALGERRLTIT
jgi:hypothetical protein